jgi:hypothetical protein
MSAIDRTGYVHQRRCDGRINDKTHDTDRGWDPNSRRNEGGGDQIILQLVGGPAVIVGGG